MTKSKQLEQDRLRNEYLKSANTYLVKQYEKHLLAALDKWEREHPEDNNG